MSSTRHMQHWRTEPANRKRERAFKQARTDAVRELTANHPEEFAQLYEGQLEVRGLVPRAGA